MPRFSKIILLLVVSLAAGYLVYSLFFKSSGLDLAEIAARMEMDCSVLEIDPDRELLGVNISRTITGPTFTCDWNGLTYEVASRPDLDRLAQALIPKMPEATGLGVDELVDDCQGVVYSASINNLIAEHLVLTTNYAFVNYSGLAGLKQAMETAGIDLKSNPSACNEFINWHKNQI